MEEHVPCQRDRAEYGAARYDPLRAFLYCEFLLYTLICVRVLTRSFQTLFAITPLNWVEWKAVLFISAPVLIIDEILKFVSVIHTTYLL